MSKKKKSRAHPVVDERGRPDANSQSARWVVIGVLILVAMFAVYRVTAPRGRSVGETRAQAGSVGRAAIPAVTGPRVDGTAVLAGGSQAISVDVTNVYSPNVIHLKAGIPATITFAGGQGCPSVVHSQELGFQADLANGPKTMRIARPKPGTYSFSCGMDMVFGQVIVN